MNNLEQENNQLKEQLAEKDKEVEELKAYKKGAYEKYVSKCAYLQQQIKDTRKQVCDEIRNKVSVSSGMISSYEELLNFRKILDQIEQAKENIDENRNKI